MNDVEWKWERVVLKRGSDRRLTKTTVGLGPESSIGPEY
jgi:hypothetical protein